jgi:hypothetical protein
MLQSARFKVNYPQADRSDSADVPRDFIAQVGGLEQAVLWGGQGTLAARPTSTAGTPGIQGRVYLATDQTPHILYYDYGTGWDAIGALTAGSVGTTQLADAGVTEPKLAPGVGGGDYGTAFPTTGLFNGYVFNIQLAAGNTGYRMIRCVYRADLDGTYPWFCTGDCWFMNSVSGNNDCSITAPKTGTYHARAAVNTGNTGTLTVSNLGRSVQVQVNGSVSIAIGSAVLEDGPVVYGGGNSVTAHFSGGSSSMSIAIAPSRLSG